MGTGFQHQRATGLIFGALLCVGSAMEFGILTFFATSNSSDGFIRAEFIVGAVVDSTSLVRQAYDVYFERLNRNGGVVIGGVTKRATLYAFNPQGESNATLDEVERATRLLIEGGINTILGSGDADWDEVAARVCHESNALFIIPLLAPASALKGRPTVFGLGTPSKKLFEGTMQLFADEGVQSVHVISEDAAWAKEACGAVGSFGIPSATNLTVQALASEEELEVAMRSSLLEQNLNASGNAIVACVASRPMCQRLVKSMVDLDYNVDAVAITNCIEADMPYDVNWQTPWNTWVVGVDSWTPNLTVSTTVTKLWDGNYFAQAYNERYSTYLVRKEYAAGVNAAWLLMRAMEATDSQNVTDLVDWLSTMNEDTDHGSFAFDSAGQLERMAALSKQFVKPNEYAVLIDSAASVSTSASLKYPKPEWQMVYCIGDLAENRGLYTNPNTRETICTDCPPSMTTNYSQEDDLRTCVLCKEGSYPYDDGVTVHCVICREGSFNNNTEAKQCGRCSPGTYQDLPGQSSCNICPVGTFSAASGQSECQSCPPDTYSRGDDRSRCEPCPDAARCVNGRITNRETYYLLNTDGGEITASDFFKCVHFRPGEGVRGEACRENGTCWTDENGDETMTGVLCGQCKAGYGKEGLTGLCEKCGGFGLMWFFAALEPFLWALIANGMIIIVLYTDFSKPKNTWNIIAKQVLSYLQMFSVASPYLTFHEQVGFKSFVQRLTWLQQYLGIDAPIISVRGANCLTSELFPGARSYQLVILAAYAYIPVVLLVTYSVFVTARCLGSPIGKSRRIMGNPKFIMVIVIYMFFLHHKTSQMLISVFRCRNFDNKHRLLLDLTVECFSEEHAPWAVVAVFGLALYSIGIPLFFFGLLSFYHRDDKLDEPWVKSMLGFLYAGYEHHVFWFESVLMLRKITFPILVAVALTFVEEGIILSPSASLEKQEEVFNTIPLMVLVLVSLFFFGLHLIFQPYDNRCYFILDHIESASLWSILITVALQVFVTVVGDLYPLVKTVLFSIVFLAHFLFWALVLWGLFRHNIMEFIHDSIIPNLHWRWLTSHADLIFGCGVKVEAECLDVTDLQSLEKDSFSSLIQEIAEKHFQSFNWLKFKGIMGTLQCMCIEANYIRKMEARSSGEQRIVNNMAQRVRKVVAASRAASTPLDKKVEFSKSVWEDIVACPPRFTVEELQMAWLNLSMQTWKDVEDKRLHAMRGTLSLREALQDGFPVKVPGQEDEESESSKASDSESESSPMGRHHMTLRIDPEDAKVSETGSRSVEADKVADDGSQKEEGRFSVSRARQERAALMRKLSELEAENEKLQLVMQVMKGMKDDLKICIQAGQHLGEDNTYFATAVIKDKEFVGKVQTQAILFKPSLGEAMEWNHEDYLHGYEDGDGLRFMVWAWGKKKAGAPDRGEVRVGMMDLTGEDVAAALESSDHVCKKYMLVEGALPREGQEPSLEVKILARYTHFEEADPLEVVQGHGQTPNQEGDTTHTEPKRGDGDGHDQHGGHATEHHEHPRRESLQGPGRRQVSGVHHQEEPAQRYSVLPSRGVKVRSAPDETSMVLGYRRHKEIVYGNKASHARGEWLKLEHDVGYMLMRQNGHLLLEEESRGVSCAEMAIMAQPFNEMQDHTDNALRRPGLEEADRVLEKSSNLSFGSSGD